MWRRKRKYVRSNPFGLGGLIPSLSSVKGVITTGLVGYAGFVGVNAGLYGLDMIGFAKLKAGKSPLVVAALNAAARILLTGVVAKLGSRFLRLDASKLALGGAFNVVYHGVQDVVASKPDIVPQAAMPMLLGYDGYGDYIGQQGMSDYVGQRGGLLGYGGDSPFAESMLESGTVLG